MEKTLNSYLEKIERHLKPLPISERVDIVKEIQSQIFELQSNGKKPEEIIERLGNPKELARAYLGDLIAKNTAFTWAKALAMFAYYSLASLSGLIIIPTLAICAPVFILCGIAVPIFGAIKLIDHLLNLGIPFAQHIGVSGINGPVSIFICCIVIGVVLFLIGCGCWKLLIYYMNGMSKIRLYVNSWGRDKTQNKR